MQLFILLKICLLKYISTCYIIKTNKFDKICSTVSYIRGVGIFFFFFFNFDNINPIIKEAFQQVCANKLLSDKYCDMGEYIAGRIAKKDIYNSLSAIKSPFAELYKEVFPTVLNADLRWKEFESNYLRSNASRQKDYDTLDKQERYHLEFIEAKAIVYWIYRVYSTAEERKEQTKSILLQIGEVFKLKNLAFADCIIYISSDVEVNFITSFDRFCKIMQKIGSPKRTFYYRGHSDVNYLLIPSIMRKKTWLEQECNMYNELIIECPEDFIHCPTHLDKLVHMQHYGLPTRLLDITRNPLVALYFACVSSTGKNGEVIVFSVEQEKIKYPGSDTATVLSSIPLFKRKDKDDFAAWAADSSINQDEFNQRAIRLLHEVKLEKPAFRDGIVKEDILNCFFVQSEKRNKRIIKQDGAFIICGLFEKSKNPITEYRYTEDKKKQIFIIPAKMKKSILEMLDKFSINKASLFPEISDVTSFISNKYLN